MNQPTASDYLGTLALNLRVAANLAEELSSDAAGRKAWGGEIQFEGTALEDQARKFTAAVRKVFPLRIDIAGAYGAEDGNA